MDFYLLAEGAWVALVGFEGRLYGGMIWGSRV